MAGPGAHSRECIELASATLERVEVPPLAPGAAAIDRAHLQRMTNGERDLEREVLRLFASQTEILLRHMRNAEASKVAAMAHTLAGSAQSIGATTFAEAAAAVEAAAATDGDTGEPLRRLSLAARDAMAEIAALLRR